MSDAYDALSGAPDDLIDQMQTWTIGDVQRRYRWVSERLISLQNERRQIAEELPALGKAFNLAYSGARTRAKLEGATDERPPTAGDLNDTAILASIEERYSLDLAKERKAAINVSIDVFEHVLDILRSVNKDARLAEGAPR